MVTKIGRRQTAHYYITEHREAKRLTLQRVAERVGVAANTIWRWENEQHRLNPQKIAALADALELQDGDSFLRPPSARQSVDALLRDVPDQVYEDAIDIVRRLVRRAS